VTERKANGVATLDDFRKMRDFEPVELVPLPVFTKKTGKKVKLRRPTPLWFLMHDRVPLTLSQRAEAEKRNLTGAEIKESVEWMRVVLAQVMVEPKCDDELLDLIDIDDATFIVRWAHGEEIAAQEGEETMSLDRFRGEREPPGAGTDG